MIVIKNCLQVYLISRFTFYSQWLYRLLQNKLNPYLDLYNVDVKWMSTT